MTAGPATAIAGVGRTALTSSSGRSVLELAAEAARAAIDDAGLTAADVDGFGTYALGDSVPAQAVATSLGAERLDWLLDLSLGGQGPCFLLALADAAIRAGIARTVVLYRAMNGRSGVRVGHVPSAQPADSAEHRRAAGLTAYPQALALWTRRYMIETGATEADLAAVVVAQRRWAERNERAVLRTPMTEAQHAASPMIASPLRVADCAREVDGACAVVVTSLEHARDLRRPPVVVRGTAFAAGPRPGREIGDILLWDDWSRNGMHHVGERIWRRSGMEPGDCDVAELYDCFSSTVLFALEGMRFVGRGEAGAFVRDGHTGLGGRLPVNTHGGLLAEGYVHGMNSLAEGVDQLRGAAGERTVAGAEVALVTSGALMDGSAAVLTVDR